MRYPSWGAPPVIVIGASAGGVEAISQIVAGLPSDFAAALFVAMHFPEHGTSMLPRILSRAGPLLAVHPRDREPFVAGRVYVAPPDHHLIVRRGTVHLVRAHETINRAIDPMFSSAALAHGARVIGVLLTGNLDDGTAGLLAIKRRGGAAIVQKPADARFPSMPASAIEHVNVDRVLTLERIPAALRAMANEIATTGAAVPNA